MNHKLQRNLTEDERRKFNRERINKTKVYSFSGTVLGKKKTKRGKKKKPDWISERKKEQQAEMEKYKQQRKERWEQYKEFKRLIKKE